MLKKVLKNGAVIPNELFMSHGYTASWNDEESVYDETVVDFDDTSIFHFKGSSFNGYETSPADGKGGVVISGVGEWTWDVSHPLLQEMAANLGKNLTSTSCAESATLFLILSISI